MLTKASSSSLTNNNLENGAWSERRQRDGDASEKIRRAVEPIEMATVSFFSGGLFDRMKVMSRISLHTPALVLREKKKKFNIRADGRVERRLKQLAASLQNRLPQRTRSISQLEISFLEREREREFYIDYIALIFMILKFN